MITIPIDLGWFILIVVAAVIILPSLVAVETNRFHSRAERKALTRRRKGLDAIQAALEQVAKRQDARDAALEDRERAVLQREQALRRRAKEASASLHAEEEHFDTAISRIDWDELPGAHELDDTVVMPAVKEGS